MATRTRGRPRHGDEAPANSELLDHALVAFADRGYDGVSVRDLCRRLGVSHNLIHQRFGSKEALWHATVDHAFDWLSVELGDALGGAVDDVDGFRRIVVRFIVVSARRPALLGVIRQESLLGGERLEYLLGRYIRPVLDVLAGVQDAMVSAGLARPINSSALFIVITQGAAGVVSMPALSRGLGLGPVLADDDAVERYAEGIVDLFLDGVLTNLGAASMRVAAE